MQSDEWWGRVAPARLNFVRGGDPTKLLSAMVSKWAQPCQVYVDRNDAAIIAARYALSEKKLVVPVLSRGIYRDLESLRTASGIRLVLFYGNLVRDELVLDAKRLSDKLAVVSGYQTPSDIISAMIYRRFVEKYTNCATAIAPAIIMHDACAMLPQSFMNGGALLEFGPPLAFEGVNLRWISAGTPAITPELLAAQAEFMARQDMGALVQILSFLDDYSATEVFAYWRTMMTTIEPPVGYQAMVQLAIERLDAMERHVEKTRAAK